jgi:hypothetical protein
MPTAKAKPASEITFIDSPNPEIATKVPITETGIAAKIIRVGKKFLKKKHQDGNGQHTANPNILLNQVNRR